MKKYLPVLAALIILAGCKKDKTAPAPMPSIVGTWSVTESSMVPTATQQPNGNAVYFELVISSFKFNQDGTGVETFSGGPTQAFQYLLISSNRIDYITFTSTIDDNFYSLNHEAFVIRYNPAPNSASLTRVGPIAGDDSGIQYETVINLGR